MHGLRALIMTLGAVALSGWAVRADSEARWLEVQSPHFVVVSNVGEARTRHVARELEMIRHAIGRVLSGDGTIDPRQRVVVLAVSRERDLRELLPQFWERKGLRPVAAYTAGPNQHAIAVRVDTSVAEWRRRLVHEYVHLLVRIRYPEAPVWLDEGLSELWSTVATGAHAIELGQPALDHLRTLRARRTRIPLNELLAMDRVPAAHDRRRLALFYAQSWALAHYVMLGAAQPALELVPSRYMEHLREGADAVTAARRAFGDLSTLGKNLAAYVQAGQFRILRVMIPQADTSAAAQDQNGGIRVRTLSPAESLAIRAGFLVDGERPGAARPLLTEALRLDPNQPRVLETLGRLHFQENNPMETARWFDRAIETGAASHLAYFYRAILAGVSNHTRGQGDVGGEEDLLRRAIELNPEFAPAYARLAGLYDRDDGGLEAALPLMRRATELEPENAGYWLELGKLLMQLNRSEEAREATAQGLAHSRSTSSRQSLKRFVGDDQTFR